MLFKRKAKKMEDLITKLQSLVDQATAALQAAQTQTEEDPAWTQVKAALQLNGWSFGKTTDIPVQTEDSSEVPVETPTE